jgi:DNA-3-methyladenine glycosylase I
MAKTNAISSFSVRTSPDKSKSIGDVARARSIDPIICEDGLTRPPWAAHDLLLRAYYDTEWGMPIRDERGLFERLSLEAFQSGLSWATILHKRESFRQAFEFFEPDRVAGFTETDIARLMRDTKIVRNKLKIVATITNAIATIDLRRDGGLADLIWSFKPVVTPMPRTMADVPSSSPESVALSKELRKRGFRFIGPTTMYALMEATGIVDTHLMDSHRRGTSGVWR